MATLRQAAQQALMALEMFDSYVEPLVQKFGGPKVPAKASTAWYVHRSIAELRAALAEPVQQPVAWADEIIDDLHAQYNTDGINEIDSGDALIRLDEAIAAVEEAEKRHTAPPQRKPLEMEEIINIGMGARAVEGPHILPVTFARAIERAHGIGGNDE